MRRALWVAALAVWPMTLAWAQPAPPRDAANAQFWWRIDNPAANPLDAPRSAYQPLVPLAGAPGPFLPAAAAGKTTVPAQALEEAAQFVQAGNGKALIVVHRGVVQLERYFGGTDAETEFSAHSFAKTLGAAAIGVALREGHIKSLDQPASTWLSEWRDPARAGITLRQLLTMSAGFRNEPSKELGSHYIQLHYGADVEAIVRDAPLAYPPGTDFAWDNDNSHALGLVIERATGQRYLDYVSSRLWQPIGASQAEQLLDRPGGRAMAYCCVWSRPRDWVRFGQMLLDGGQWQGKRLLDESFVRELRSPSAANPNFGYQVAVGAAWQDPRLNRRALSQGDDKVAALAPDLYYLSGVGGLQAVMVPSEQLLILRVGKASSAWREHVLPNLLVGALRGEKQADWGWLYDWRMANRSAPGALARLDFSQPQNWPVERVTGRPAAALPRRSSACLNAETLAPALAEVQRVRSERFLVWHDGAVVFEQQASPAAAEARIEPASMAKSVTGLMVGQALADGAIPSLDVPVSRWLSEWAGDPRGAITVRQMLQMASGLSPLPFDMAPGSAYSRALYGADNASVPLAAALVDTPGSRFNYASGVSQLLGLIVERATGRRYADYLSERLWQPLGAADAWVALDHPGGQARTSSGLYARAEDWLRLGLLWMQRGQVDGKTVVSPAWLDAMAAASPANPNYGLHLWRASPHAPQRFYNTATPATMPASEPFLAADMLYFDGAGAQRVYLSPAERLVIVRTGASSSDWDDSRVPNQVVAALRGCKPAS